MRFIEYYEHGFGRDITGLFMRYKSAGHEVVFHGFGKDLVPHMDKFYLEALLKELPFSSGEQLANFAMGVWTMTASDICAYSLFPEKEYLWFRKTGYPKITGWNYSAIEPNWILNKLIDLYPEMNLEEHIRRIVSEEGDRHISKLVDEMRVIIGNSRTDAQRIRDFLESWLTPDAIGFDFDRHCFLHPCRGLEDEADAY